MNNYKARKSIIFTVILMMTLMWLSMFSPKRVYAAGVSVYADNDVVYVGDSVTVTVTLYGDEIYAYSGYIGCDGIFSGANEGFADGAGGGGSVSISYTYRAVSEGEGAVYVSDCMVSDGITRSDCGGGACYITVLGYDDGGGGTGGNAGGNDYNDDYSYDGGYINGNEPGEGSGNCNLSSLSIEGYELIAEGHDIYSATVGENIEIIKIVAEAEDEKATVKGAGEQVLKVGENVFEVTVTAENGLSKTYTIKVLRKGSKIALSELLTWLANKNNKEEFVTIELKDGEILNSEMIDALGKWGKTVNLNQYDKEGKLVYSWKLETKNFASSKDFKEFNPAVTFTTENEEKINELSNYASSKFLNFAYAGNLPKGTTFTLAVDKDFKDTDKIRLYYFNPEKTELELVNGELMPEKGYLRFELSHCSDYILTRSEIGGAVKSIEKSNNKIYLILLGIALVAIIILAVILIIVLNKKKKAENEENNQSSSNELPVIEVEDLEFDELENTIEERIKTSNPNNREEANKVWQKRK